VAVLVEKENDYTYGNAAKHIKTLQTEQRRRGRRCACMWTAVAVLVWNTGWHSTNKKAEMKCGRRTDVEVVIDP